MWRESRDKGGKPCLGVDTLSHGRPDRGTVPTSCFFRIRVSRETFSCGEGDEGAFVVPIRGDTCMC